MEGYKEGKALREAQRNEALLVTKCDKGHFYNARWQSGLCPHLNTYEQANQALRQLQNANLPTPPERKVH